MSKAEIKAQKQIADTFDALLGNIYTTLDNVAKSYGVNAVPMKTIEHVFNIAKQGYRKGLKK